MKSVNQISEQLSRIHVTAYENYIRLGEFNRGWDIQDKAREIADRYYLNIWNYLGAMSHNSDELITKQNAPIEREIYAK